MPTPSPVAAVVPTSSGPSSGGPADGLPDLRGLERSEASRYLLRVLLLPPGPDTDQLVERALERTTRRARRRRGRGPDSARERLHLALREEVWRQRHGPGGRGRRLRLLVAAIVLLAAGGGFAARQRQQADRTEATTVRSGPESTATAPAAGGSATTTVVPVGGTVVRITVESGSSKLGFRTRAEVDVTLTGTSGEGTYEGRSTEAGPLTLAGVAPGRYRVTVDVPAGYRLAAAASGDPDRLAATLEVDETGQPAVTVRLERT